jgi:hypothetical protein
LPEIASRILATVSKRSSMFHGHSLARFRVLTGRAAAALTLLVVASGGLGLAQAPKPVPVTVYKSPTCGCCGKWVEHMRANGFEVTVSDMPDVTPMKDKQGVPAALRSCHTALVGGYAIEGHVPADVIKKLLTEKPNAAGIAVPGMPMGSPGMEGASKDTYSVVLFDKAGKTSVYATR